MEDQIYYEDCDVCGAHLRSYQEDCGYSGQGVESSKEQEPTK